MMYDICPYRQCPAGNYQHTVGRAPEHGGNRKVNTNALAYRVGTVIAEELLSFGFNMNFAPVLDINSNPNNPIIGDRAFIKDERECLPYFEAEAEIQPERYDDKRY